MGGEGDTGRGYSQKGGIQLHPATTGQSGWLTDFLDLTSDQL